MTAVLHHVAALLSSGHYAQAVHVLHSLLYHYRNNAHALDLIHKAMYAMNPDWGL